MKKILLLIPTVSVFILVLPFIVSYGEQIMVVTSTSMLPTLQPNDLIVIKPAVVSQVSVGDIIVFDSHFELGKIVHRAVEIKHDNGKTGIITKGDNVPRQDGWIVYDDSMIGIVEKTIPYFGVLFVDSLRYILIAIVIIASVVLFKEYFGENKRKK